MTTKTTRSLHKSQKTYRLKSTYNPNIGYVGATKVGVSNYLFAKSTSAKTKTPKGYPHNFKTANIVLNTPPKEHYRQSQLLTQFLRKRDLTYSKSTKKGNKTFTVPVTSTPVCLPKSTFDTLERAAQVLMIVLRKVAQSIYGSESIEDSEFIKALPAQMQSIFIDAIKSSPQYIKQLHNPVMRQYPFFDVVGLDLVLVEDYLQRAREIPSLLSAGAFEKLPSLPFRLLEINAGAPSGAANNAQIMEGLASAQSDLLNSFERVLPNDHFETLAKTYNSLGAFWTERSDGISIILPPGGSNGATPEIQQLALKSGLLYVDPAQLYKDENGYVRLRTITGNNPIVTSIYSRVNADSALFSIDKNILLRDQDTGETLYLSDGLILDDEGKEKPILDQNGQKIPLESSHAVPDCIEAIHNKKLYLGSLNRILDNKIILATLTNFGPSFYKSELEKLGFTSEDCQLLPPDTLEPKAESIDVIRKNPDDWVIKVPDGAGGKGVYILRALSAKQKQTVIAKAAKAPDSYAYQKLVCIGRIPVAVKNESQNYRFANLAADIRMWIFYGADDALPKLTHNGLVRFASQEKGKLSSIVNTSQGGGYAPLLIIDDLGKDEAIDFSSHILPKPPIPIRTDAPIFVAAQILQVDHIFRQVYSLVQSSSGTPIKISQLLSSLKTQTRELLAYFDANCMEHIARAVQIADKKIAKLYTVNYLETRQRLKLQIIQAIANIETILPKRFFEKFDEKSENNDELIEILLKVKTENPLHLQQILKLRKLLTRLNNAYEHQIFSNIDYKNILEHLNRFYRQIQNSLASHHSKTYIELLSPLAEPIQRMSYRSLFYKNNENLGSNYLEKSPCLIASQFEYLYRTKLIDSAFVSFEIKSIHAEWKKIILQSTKVYPSNRKDFIEKARLKHFERFPKLKRLQLILDDNFRGDVFESRELLEALPYAKFNIDNFCTFNNIDYQQLFETKLKAARIAILDKPQLEKLGLPTDSVAGECFAQKRSQQSLFHDSKLLLWIRKDLTPFVKFYTIGHELIHFYQIYEMMCTEKLSMQQGPRKFAEFVNFYGNFLGLAAPSVAANATLGRNNRLPFFGLADLMSYKDKDPLIKGLLKSAKTGDLSFNEKISQYGSLLGYLVKPSNQSCVKALREVIPALENGRNIRFAKDLGLNVGLCEFKAMLPIANTAQIKRFKSKLESVFESPNPSAGALWIIANHQVAGVRFAKPSDVLKLVSLEPGHNPIHLSQSYNSMQQQ